MSELGGSYCPACGEDSGVDAEEWGLKHDFDTPVSCKNCGAKLTAHYDEYEAFEGFWMFEAEDSGGGS